jgi:hypothetical protein
MTSRTGTATWRVVLLALASGISSAPLAAQAGTLDPQCRAVTPSERITQDGCQKALDLFTFMAPQLGMLLVGGNAVAGEHSALRGPGHVSLGLRANAMQASLPRVDERTPSTTGAVASSYSVESQWVAAPALDAAIGLFRGVPLVGTYALGVDALVNLAYIPSVDSDELTIDVPNGSFKFGFGGRLGVLAETFLTPGISITWLRRDLPTVNIAGRVSGDELNVRDARVQTTAWRVVAGKNLSVFGLAVGWGRDRYDTSADAQVTINRVVPPVTSSVVSARHVLDRNNLFANATLNLPALRLVAELGRVSGSRVLSTYNSFSGERADDPRTYASLGVRVNW